MAKETSTTFEEMIGAPVLEDINPLDWLGKDDSQATGFIPVVGGRMKVSAITEGELNRLVKQSQDFDPRTKSGKMNPGKLRLAIICYSINKANGTQITAEQLQNKLVGELTTIQKEIFRISGMGPDEEATVPEDFFA